MPIVANGEILPRLPYLGCRPFRSPSEGPFGALFSAALSAPAALWKKTLNAYYLFVIGLIYLIPLKSANVKPGIPISGGKFCLSAQYPALKSICPGSSSPFRNIPSSSKKRP